METRAKLTAHQMSVSFVALVQGEAVQGAVILPVRQHLHDRQLRRIVHTH